MKWSLTQDRIRQAWNGDLTLVKCPKSNTLARLRAAPSFHYVLLLSPQNIAGLGALQRHSRAQTRKSREVVKNQKTHVQNANLGHPATVYAQVIAWTKLIGFKL
jgi:hypothetical protein